MFCGVRAVIAGTQWTGVKVFWLPWESIRRAVCVPTGSDNVVLTLVVFWVNGTDKRVGTKRDWI